MSVAYAAINGKWCRCVSSLLLQFRALTQLELRYAFYLVRLRLKAAPSSDFEAVLAEVLEEALPPVAEATATSRSLYKPYGLASITARQSGDGDSPTAHTEEALPDGLYREHKPERLDHTGTNEEKHGKPGDEADRLTRHFEEFDFHDLPIRNPL
ncbi:hypothetical protein [Caballeronia sp. GAOx1]|uniref:hypothetical protein n=1 Tax=Caballeronia sp. GAOx1 TaxID=2921761 RepID=UPI00202978C0|nr:hypothetical protein [Caballeronia sp. GAOx1]